MPEEELKFLKCLANETRLNIIQLLEDRELCVCDIMEELDKEQSLISHHLRSLRGCGLIERRREGKKLMYSISDPSVVEFLSKAEELGREFC